MYNEVAKAGVYSRVAGGENGGFGGVKMSGQLLPQLGVGIIGKLNLFNWSYRK